MKFQEQRLLSELCTFGIGGPAKYFVEVRTVDELKTAFDYCRTHHLRYFILGKGSNCLFDDQGFDGLVILNKIDFIEHPSPGIVRVGAGYSFSLLGTQTARQGYEGLEFASGIPGSVGGALFMNAGANGKETCDSLLSVEYLSADGQCHEWTKEQLRFAYRTSSFQEMDGAITAATFALQPSQTARSTQIEIITYRKKTQPYHEKSAGCVFRNPNCGHAGALIDRQGLKGMQVGGAKVSEMHANFIINTHQATAQDVLTLMKKIQEKIFSETGIELESEVRYVQNR